jgi:DnaK suppressor protein
LGVHVGIDVSMTAVDEEVVGRTLAAERHRLDGQAADLTRDLQAIIEASADTNADDEHDPEGSTIGFERAQVASLLHQVRTGLAELDRAEARLRAGTYGRCESCGAPIAAERLTAHPTAIACMECATASPASGRPPLRRRRLPGRKSD